MYSCVEFSCTCKQVMADWYGFRCLYWENQGKQTKVSGSMRLSCTVMGDHAKTDKPPKKGKTRAKSPATNQTVCVKSEEKLTKSKRKSEEVSVEKTKQSPANSKSEAIVKRHCKGLGKEGQKEGARKKKEEGEKTSELESSDCQSPSNSSTSKDTVSQFFCCKFSVFMRMLIIWL